MEGAKGRGGVLIQLSWDLLSFCFMKMLYSAAIFGTPVFRSYACKALGSGRYPLQSGLVKVIVPEWKGSGARADAIKILMIRLVFLTSWNRPNHLNPVAMENPERAVALKRRGRRGFEMNGGTDITNEQRNLLFGTFSEFLMRLRCSGP